MNIDFESINFHQGELDQLFIQIDKTWLQSNESSIIPFLNEKKESILKLEIDGEVLLVDSVIQGIYWVEKVTPHYGNILIHTFDQIFDPIILNRIKQIKALQNILGEVIHFRDPAYFLSLLEELGFNLSPRQRMALWLNEIEEEDLYPLEDASLSFEQLDNTDTAWLSKLSFDAHQISQDQKYSPDLQTIEQRSKLDSLVFTEKVGKLVKSASLKVVKDKVPIGAIIIVEQKCWDRDDVAWVF